MLWLLQWVLSWEDGNPVVIMEASGLGLCPLALSILSHEQRLGALLLYSHNFALGEVRSSHACTRSDRRPALRCFDDSPYDSDGY